MALELQHPVRFSLLVLAALASGWFALRDRGPPVAAAAAPRLGLGYYVRDARLTGTGPDGRILYRVSASAGEQLLADGTITLHTVAVDYEPAAEVPWQLRADRGQIPPDRNIIELAGDVTARTASSPAATGARRGSSAAPLLIRTDYLELDPDAYIARTERRVAVESDGDTLRARGMRVYLKQDRLQFDADVHGRFLP
jgi:LPS export ABC transporter protein LptC